MARQHDIVIAPPREGLPSCSWWVGLSRTEFVRACAAQSARMAGSKHGQPSMLVPQDWGQVASVPKVGR